MDVINAINERFSCRDFEDREVPKDILEKIVAAALHTPSWQNSQPWDVYVAGYNTSKKIISMATDRSQQGEMYLEVGHSGAWSMDTMQRIRKCMKDIQEYCPGKKMQVFSQLNTHLFNAPAMVFVAMDENLGAWSIFDIGAFCQSIMLAAMEYDVKSIVAVAYVNRPEVIRQVMGIPADKRLVIGIGLGYENKNNPLNNLRTDRKSIKEVVFKD